MEKIRRSTSDVLENMSPVWIFFLPFRNLACSNGATWYYFTLCHSFELSAHRETMKGVVKYTKTHPAYGYVLPSNAKDFNRFLAFLELHKTLQPDGASEIITDDGNIKWRKSDKIIVGGRLKDYLLPCNPYGYNNPNQREFEVNVVVLIAHAFTFLLLMDHECFRKMMQDIDSRRCRVGCSKMSRSLITADAKLV